MTPRAGQWLIAAMIAAGALAAGASWWFRFTATHRAAVFWGPAAAALIRDAPQVELLTLKPAVDGPTAMSDPPILTHRKTWQIVDRRDVSQAAGLTHLRNALVEDRSFTWPAQSIPVDTQWTTALRFRSGLTSSRLDIIFSQAFRLATASADGHEATQAASCQPIADGLRDVVSEWSGAAREGNAPAEPPAR